MEGGGYDCLCLLNCVFVFVFTLTSLMIARLCGVDWYSKCTPLDAAGISLQAAAVSQGVRCRETGSWVRDRGKNIDLSLCPLIITQGSNPKPL